MTHEAEVTKRTTPRLWLPILVFVATAASSSQATSSRAEIKPPDLNLAIELRRLLRRFTRLTIGFSRKLENLKAAVALHFAYYNFCRVSYVSQNHSRDGGWIDRSRLVYC